MCKHGINKYRRRPSTMHLGRGLDSRSGYTLSGDGKNLGRGDRPYAIQVLLTAMAWPARGCVKPILLRGSLPLYLLMAVLCEAYGRPAPGNPQGVGSSLEPSGNSRCNQSNGDVHGNDLRSGVGTPHLSSKSQM